MAKVLLVKGHPLDKEESYSVRLLEDFKKSYIKHYPEDEIITLDVYEAKIPDLDKSLLDALKRQKNNEFLFEKEEDLLKQFNVFSEQLLDVDKVVIANPLWNLHIPSRLLTWINSLNVVGKTFKYTAQGPVGLVEGKKLLHIQANGGIYEGQDPASQYIKSIFGFLGFKDIESLYFEGHAYDPSRADDLYADALVKMEEILTRF